MSSTDCPNCGHQNPAQRRFCQRCGFDLPSPTTEPPRQIELRRDTDGESHWILRASIDDHGRLIVDGHDLGPAVERALGVDEYEYRFTVEAGDVSALCLELGASNGESILDHLEARFRGEQSYAFEQRLRDSSVDVKFEYWR